MKRKWRCESIFLLYLRCLELCVERKISLQFPFVQSNITLDFTASYRNRLRL